MPSSFLANTNINSVSERMMGVVDYLHDYPRAERLAVIICLFNSVFKLKLKDTYSVTDIMEIVDNMRVDTNTRWYNREFAGAERYVKEEL